MRTRQLKVWKLKFEIQNFNTHKGGILGTRRYQPNYAKYQSALDMLTYSRLDYLSFNYHLYFNTYQILNIYAVILSYSRCIYVIKFAYDFLRCMWLLVLIQTLIGAKKEGDAEVYGQMPLRNSELFSWCSLTRREKCPNRKIFWSVFSCIRTEYGDLTRKSPYSVRI